ncbi:hypothetical protein FB45DRAFT_1142705, partial [Roridomyces roridus]
RREDSLRVYQESLDRAELYSSLVNVTVDAFNIGRNDDAKATAGEAIQLGFKIGLDSDPATGKTLMSALKKLSARLLGPPDNQEALHIIEEAVSFCRHLVKAKTVFTEDLVELLDQLYVCLLGCTGRWSDTLCTAEEAVVLRRKLAETNPDLVKNFMPSLRNLIADFRLCGNYEGALRAYGEAVKLRQMLAERDTQATEDALLVEKEVVELNRTRAAQDEGLAASLSNLTFALGIVGQHEDAVRAGEESVHLYRQDHQGLAVTEEARKFGLALALQNMARSLRATAREDDASHAYEESFKLYRELAEIRPELMAPKCLAVALDLHDVGFNEDALSVSILSVESFRKLGPVADTASFLKALKVTAKILRGLKREDEAEKIEAEITELEAGESPSKQANGDAVEVASSTVV